MTIARHASWLLIAILFLVATPGRPAAQTVPPSFDFSMVAFSVTGNIQTDFSDLFLDDSLDVPPTSSLGFFSFVEESEGRLRLASDDGSLVATSADGTTLADAGMLNEPLVKGRGHVVISGSFLADQPGPGQYYGIAIIEPADVPREGVYLLVAGDADGIPWVIATDPSGTVLAADRLILTDEPELYVHLELSVDDALGTVGISYCVENFTQGFECRQRSVFEFSSETEATIFRLNDLALATVMAGVFVPTTP